MIVEVNDTGFSSYFSVLRDEASLNHPFLTGSDISYQIEYMHPASFQDYSFVVLKDNDPVLGVIVTRHEQGGQQIWSGYGRPIQIICHRDESLLTQEVKQLCLSHLTKYMAAYSGAKWFYQHFNEDYHLSFIDDFFLSSGAKEIARQVQVIDLMRSVDEMKRDVRKSYKSLINWGMKNFDINIIGETDDVDQAIEGFRQLHIAVAGRETRSQKSWQAQAAMIKAGEAFAVMAYWQGTLVSAVLIMHTASYAYYAVSASRRELFEKPMAHSVLWSSILEAKHRGCQWFETGEIISSQDPLSNEKEKSISVFKQGFGGFVFNQTELILECL